ncbi:MAG: hypothetical protein FWC75_04765 [Oscillospiraceae bacterium]|nr:hypothetical protein [Oscillospiraceae bacterium]
MDEVKRNYKDTLFKYVFKERRHFVDLYEAFSGKRLSADDITCFDLDSDVVQRERYNDVSFITTDNRLIYMVEHQSTVSSNLAVKLGAYFFELLKLWIEREGVNIHSEQEAMFPKPELYVAYNGKKPLSRGHECYDCGEFLQIKVPIVNIRYNKLKNKHTDNYLAGYSYLQYEYEKKLSERIPELEAFKYAVRQCETKGYLSEIVEKEDFTAVYNDLFSYDNQLRAEGRAEGKLEGKLEGEAKAVDILKRYLKQESPERIAESMGLALHDVLSVINKFMT